MQRRDLLKGALGAAVALPLGALAQSDDPVRAAFASHRDRPWTLGFEGLQQDAPPMALRTTGRWPAELRGAFYRIGPARHELGGMRYHHWFDGDGMLQRYEIGAGGITHRGRFVRTEKFVAETAAGRFSREAFGTHPPEAEPVTSADSINVANTSVVSHGGELMALWEGGSATILDPATLDSRGVKTWSPEYRGMPFSAHPKREVDGTLWNFGVSSGQGLLSLYRIGADGALLMATTFPVPDIAMVHDFAVTERHLVFLLPPLVFDRDRLVHGATFLDAHVWRPDMPLRALVVDKNDVAKRQWFELPAGFVFHVGNAWEDGRGTIRLDYVRAPSAWSAQVGIPMIMAGRFEERERNAVAQVVLDTRTGQARQTLVPCMAEFPKVDPRVVGQRHRQLYLSARSMPMDRPGYDSVMRLDTERGSIDRYRFGERVMVEEHLFVPRRNSTREGDGWLVGTALDLDRRAMLLNVFDARQVSAGPVAQAVLARPMPLGLHGAFVGAV